MILSVLCVRLADDHVCKRSGTGTHEKKNRMMCDGGASVSIIFSFLNVRVLLILNRSLLLKAVIRKNDEN